MICALRHFGLVVQDLEVSLHFYCVLLGMGVARRMEESGPFLEKILDIPGVKVTTVKLMTSEGTALLELLNFTNPKSEKKKLKSLASAGYTHMSFTVNGLDNLYQHLLAKKVTFLSEPSKSPDGKALVAFCKDPEGNWIELVEEVVH